MAISSLLVGSYEGVPAATLSIVANAVTDGTQVVPTGNYYLDDLTANLSLCRQLEEALEAHAQITTANVSISEDRLVRITTNVACTISWTGDITARNLLGFTGNQTPLATTHVAQRISPLLWSPGRVEISREARKGTAGRKVYDTKVGMSGTSVMRAAQHNHTVNNEFEWRNVLNSRVWTTAELGGEFVVLFDTVLRRFWRFKVWLDFDDDSSSAAMVEPSDFTRLGPYKMRWDRGAVAWDYKHEIEMVEKYHPIELPVVVTQEFS